MADALMMRTQTFLTQCSLSVLVREDLLSGDDDRSET